MLRRMRWRFIIAAMTAMMIVMFGIVVVINVWNCVVTDRRQDGTIREIWADETGGRREPGRPPEQEKPPEPEKPPQGPKTRRGEGPTFQMKKVEIRTHFIVYIGTDGEVMEVSLDFTPSVTEEEAGEYGRQVIERGRQAGYWKNYRYNIFDTEEGQAIVFLNVGREIEFMKTLFIISAMTALLSMALVFLLVVLFSKRAIGPYIKNMERQKRFITDAGHELKTPITSISTSAEVLEMEQGENEWTRNILKQTQRLAKLTEELVFLSRLDEETPFPEKQKFSLSEAAWEIAEPFETAAKARGKRYEAEIQDGLALFGDRAAIQRMISILLDNAMRYSDEKGEIRLRIYRKNKKNHIEVENTCDLRDISGLDQWFDRFYRSDASRSRNTGGSGIGLSIARAVCESHGGRILASSADGKRIQIHVIL